MKVDTHDDDTGYAMVDLTPLIDAVFLLLIFFMVTATFQNDERDLAIKVPTAESGNPMVDLPELIVVGVRRDGELTVGGKELEKDDLRSLLVRAKRKNEKQRVIARVDGDAAFRHSVVVLDLCTGLGIETSVAVSEAKGN
jgi:biopolymer transport protein ExbD